ncbi:LRR and PYD domains-containing 1b allele 5-like protein [Labeo rohita]|uniref:LRR and PYD domains-containing 1b allele 5-like protein n=1 Tax=Labeo rohita TaxID=84645 RepID=A0A498P0B9_LABRO|nr:LRR and PYD domains-containing 1b allele 5-like protein [Labeo rohita]
MILILSSRVVPRLELKYKPIKPDFFEVFIDTPKDFYLQLMPQHHNKGVWDAKIRQADYSQRVSTVEADTAQQQECKNDNGAEFVEKHRVELIERVSLVEPIADDMKCQIGDAKYQTILNSGTSTNENTSGLPDNTYTERGTLPKSCKT